MCLQCLPESSSVIRLHLGQFHEVWLQRILQDFGASFSQGKAGRKMPIAVVGQNFNVKVSSLSRILLLLLLYLLLQNVGSLAYLSLEDFSPCCRCRKAQSFSTPISL